jgi:hypothetical protein
VRVVYMFVTHTHARTCTPTRCFACMSFLYGLPVSLCAIYLSIYLYIHRERERERERARERARETTIPLPVSLRYPSIYLSIYTERERESEREDHMTCMHPPPHMTYMSFPSLCAIYLSIYIERRPYVYGDMETTI